MISGNEFKEETFVMESSEMLTRLMEKNLKQALETTPIGSSLASLESAILLRSVSAVFGATILPTTLSLKEYSILKRRVVNCIKTFTADAQEGFI